MTALLEELPLEALSGDGPIDAGAEEELFRDVGRQAAAEVLARRWEQADGGAVGRCRQCGMELQDLGLRRKGFKRFAARYDSSDGWAIAAAAGRPRRRWMSAWVRTKLASRRA